MVGCLDAAAAFAGVLLAGRWTRTRWLAKGLGVPQKMASWIIMGVAIGLLIISSLAKLWAVVPIGMVVSFVGGMYLPPLLTTVAMTCPARVRSQGFSLFQGLRQGLGVGGGPADNGPTAEGVGPPDERPAVEKAVDTAGQASRPKDTAGPGGPPRNTAGGRSTTR